jgi:hypothetical protein
MTVRILLIDDQRVVRSGVGALLEAEFDQVHLSARPATRRTHEMRPRTRQGNLRQARRRQSNSSGGDAVQAPAELQAEPMPR